MTSEHPEDWTPSEGAFDQDALEIALDAVEDEADNHGGEYGAGMRHAHLIFEESLLIDD